MREWLLGRGDLLDPTGFIQRSFLPGSDHLTAPIPTGRMESIAKSRKVALRHRKKSVSVLRWAVILKDMFVARMSRPYGFRIISRVATKKAATGEIQTPRGMDRPSRAQRNRWEPARSDGEIKEMVISVGNSQFNKSTAWMNGTAYRSSPSLQKHRGVTGNRLEEKTSYSDDPSN